MGEQTIIFLGYTGGKIHAGGRGVLPRGDDHKGGQKEKRGGCFTKIRGGVQGGIGGEEKGRIP